MDKILSEIQGFALIALIVAIGAHTLPFVMDFLNWLLDRCGNGPWYWSVGTSAAVLIFLTILRQWLYPMEKIQAKKEETEKGVDTEPE